MKIQQVRNATIRIEFGGKTILVDPMLAPKDAYPPLPFTPNQHLRNPTVELPMPIEAIVASDAVLVTHMHPDHWDDAAKEILPKDRLLIVQDADDAEQVREAGFSNVLVMGEGQPLAGVELIRTEGQHGSDAIMEQFGHVMGAVSGFVLKAPSEKSLYVAGDTVWNDHVAAALAQHDPDVVVLNCGDAQLEGQGSIIMNKEDVRSVFDAAPRAVIVCSHMESVNHAMLTRAELRQFVLDNDMSSRVLIPEDGQILSF